MISKNINSDINKSKHLQGGVVVWILLALMLIGGNFINNKVIVTLTLFMIIIYFIFISLNQKVKMLFFFIPWIYILKTQNEMTSYFSYLIIILFISVILKNKPIFNIKKSIYIIVMIIIILFQKLVIASFINTDEMIFFISLITLSIYINTWNESFNWDEVAIAFILGLFFSILGGGLLYDLPHMSEFFNSYYAVKGKGIGLRFSGLHLDPNGFGAQSIFGYILGIILITQKKLNYDLKVKVALIAMSLVIFFTGFLSGSKAYLFITIAIIISYIIMLIFKGEIKKSSKLIIVIFIILFIGYSLNWFEPINIRYNARLTNITDSNSFSSGRFKIYNQYFEMLANHPWVFFIGSTLDKINLQNAAHNTLIQSVTRIGVINLIILVMFFKSMYQTVSYSNKYNKIKENLLYLRFMPLLAYILYSQTLDLLFKNEFIYIIFLGIYISAYFRPKRQ